MKNTKNDENIKYENCPYRASGYCTSCNNCKYRVNGYCCY